MKSILITGAGGYVGSRLCEQLSRQGHQITALMRRDKHGAETAWNDALAAKLIGEWEDVHTQILRLRDTFDTVIHLVSLDHHRSNGPIDEVMKTNVNLTWSLLEALSGSSVERFFYFSTTQVYGGAQSDLIRETQPPSSQNPYGLTHQLSESICEYFNDKGDIRCASVRLANSFGSPVFADANCWWLVINDLCKSAIETGRIQLGSDGSPSRDFIHWADLCSGVKHLVEAELTDLESIYHLASGNSLSIGEAALKIANEANRLFNMEISVFLPDGSLFILDSESRPEQRINYDLSNLRKLGFCPNQNISAGIVETLNYLKAEQ